MSRGYVKWKHEKIWYVIESPNKQYIVRTSIYVKHDLRYDERTINEEPLTWHEAEVFRKLLTGVQS